jgi:predicted metal-dependent enzyme (double-stranded beta helix superfamily)
VALLAAWDAAAVGAADDWGQRLDALLASAEAEAWWTEALAGESGTRTVLFEGTQGVRLIGRRWAAGESTALHDHGGAAGAEVVLDGALTLYPYRRGADGVLQREGMTLLVPGTVQPLEAAILHRAHNPLPAPSVSLHLYGPAVRPAERVTLHA